jgi:hypothetical protein
VWAAQQQTEGQMRDKHQHHGTGIAERTAGFPGTIESRAGATRGIPSSYRGELIAAAPAKPTDSRSTDEH